jgi:nicotinamide-nucleotide amidase
MFDVLLVDQARDFIERARARNIRVVTAESCTGGLIASLLTEIPKSSDVVERGFVTYSNEAKTDLLGVPPNLIQTQRAVSKEVAAAMAEGALRHSRGKLAIAVTGIAGPSGGSVQKPVGLVFIALADQRGATAYKYCFGDIGRDQVRLSAVREAIKLLKAAINS